MYLIAKQRRKWQKCADIVIKSYFNERNQFFVMSHKEFKSLNELIDELISVSNFAEESYQHFLRFLNAHSNSCCVKGCMDLFPNPKIVSSAKVAIDSFLQQVTTKTIASTSISENVELVFFIRACKLFDEVIDIFDKLDIAYKQYEELKRPYKCEDYLFILDQK